VRCLRIRIILFSARWINSVSTRRQVLAAAGSDKKSGGVMGQQVTNGAMMMCSFGMAPSSLIVLPVNRTMAGGLPAATIMDHIPMVNIMPFGMCMSLANPMVATATAAAMGVFTPMPCIPMTVAPWIPGSPTALVASMPALNNTSTCMCTWGGVIQITMPGQMTTMVP
jgi:Domain of unknown function (DUF4280)